MNVQFAGMQTYSKVHGDTSHNAARTSESVRSASMSRAFANAGQLMLREKGPIQIIEEADQVVVRWGKDLVDDADAFVLQRTDDK